MNPQNQEEVYAFYQHPIIQKDLYESIKNAQYPLTKEACEKAHQHYPLLLNIAKEMASGSRVLDWGCGAGEFAVMFSMYGHHVTFADISGPAFDLLQKKLESLLHNVSFIRVDKDDLPSAEHYDAILCQEVLEHVWEPEDHLKIFYNVLKPGGLLMMGTFFNCIDGADPSHLHHNCERYQDPPTWFAVVEKHGFELYKKDQNGVEKVWRKS